MNPVTSLQELADLAGVSRATASRALNDNPRISKKTRQKLQQLALEAGYSINRRARDLRLKKTSIIAVVLMLDLRSKQHMSDLFFLDMLGAIADALASRDYDLLLSHTPSADALNLADSRLKTQSDGAIFIGQERQHARLNRVAQTGHPMVVWGHAVADRDYTVVGSDNETGGYLATRQLLLAGRRRIAFFGDVINPEMGARFAGYQRALSEYDIPFDPALQFDVPFRMDQARMAVMKLIEVGIPFDAVVCSSDVLALATIGALQSAGRSVPNDIAVTGYDDIGFATHTNPPLTTVRQNIGEAGEALVNTLLRKIEGESVADTILPAELVVRESCGSALPKNS